MKRYTSIQISRELRKKLYDFKYDLKLHSYEEVLNVLLRIKNVSFIIEREGRKREISGIALYDKLRDGWKIISYKTKGEDIEDGQPEQV